jgi:hypothetical protein
MGKVKDRNVYCRYCEMPTTWHEKHAKFPLSKLKAGIDFANIQLCRECFVDIGLTYLAYLGVPIHFPDGRKAYLEKKETEK